MSISIKIFPIDILFSYDRIKGQKIKNLNGIYLEL